MEREQNRNDKLRKEKARKAFLIALGISAAGGVAYLMWDHLRQKKIGQSLLPESTSDTVINITNALPANATSSNAVSTTDSFPLKQGSRGTRVTQLQQALDNIMGAGTMKKSYGGIDGILGPLTAAALRKAGFSEVIDEATFATILNRGGLPAQFNASEIATSLYWNALAGNITGTIAALQKIYTVEQYSQVNELYRKLLIVDKSIVTDLLDYSFKYNDAAKQQIRDEFLRIGLKQNSSGTWSLSGINDILTIRDTFVTDRLSNRVPVKRNTILGDEIRSANGMTWFRSIDNSVLQVPTQDVKYAN